MTSRFLFFLLLGLFTSVQLSAQCISGNCIDGKGTYVYPSGAKYIGEFANGEIHGIGVCYYTDGSKYAGQWSHRFPQGKGTKTFEDGTKWTGLWEKGQPVDEQGNIVAIGQKEEAVEEAEATVQSGCLSGDCEYGTGVFAYPDGSRYEGDFVDGKLNGNGTWYYPNGDFYAGQFKDNYMHGEGTLTLADGKVTSGDWAEGEYIGDRSKTEVAVGCQEGDCENGVGTYVYQDNAAIYAGAFKDGLAHGKGSCDYSNGDHYEGEWANGSFNGYGALYLKDGTVVQGYWVDGTYMGREDKRNEDVATATTTTPETPLDAAALREAMGMKVWAVIVGISSYSHMPALRYTDDDAYRMYAFLKSPEGGALPDERMRILIDEDATRENIVNAMMGTFGQAGPNDLVLLYFSGHGLRGSFLPIDFDGFNNKLYHDEINEILKQSPAKYKLCIADACHSGSLFAMKGTYEHALVKYYKTLAQADPGTALIMSSKSEETSLESSGLRQGVFSHFLIRGLKGEADNSGDKVVSVKELFDFIHENVRSYTGMRQSPVIKGDYDPKMTVSVVR